MKRAMLTIAVLMLVGFFVAGCATPFPLGSIYTEVQMPVAASEGVSSKKFGESTCKSILGIVAVGDSSIATACRNGGITKISFVDYHVENILGVIGKYTTRVYGE